MSMVSHCRDPPGRFIVAIHLMSGKREEQMFMEKVRDKVQEPDGKFTKQIGTTVYTVNVFLSKDTTDTYADRMMRLMDRELCKVKAV